MLGRQLRGLWFLLVFSAINIGLNGDANPDKGVGVLFDVGYAIGPWEPLLLVDWFKFGSKDDFKDQYFGLHGGLNFWWKGHAVNWKLDVGWVKDAGVDMGKGQLQTTLQTQLLL